MLAANRYQEKRKNAYVMDWKNTFATNLYRPTYINGISYSAKVRKGNDLASPALTNRVALNSVALADTLSFLDKTLQVTLGARWQQLYTQNFAYNTGALNQRYKEAHVSPSLGVVYRFTPEISAYANYIESLAQGETAPSNAHNKGDMLSPYVSKQKEIGVKYESQSSFGASLALFSTEKPARLCR